MKRLAALGIVLVLAVVLYFFLDQFNDLSIIKEHQLAVATYYEHHRGKLIFLYMAIYIVVTALSLPGAALMTLFGGAIFGFFTGVLVVSFASTIGATCAFLLARFLFRDAIQQRWGQQLVAINEGIEKEGALYLFMMRLVPVFPFFMINILMALTPIRIIPFFLVSQVGMLLGTLVYVNAGTELAQLETVAGLLSPSLMVAFTLLGVLPLLAKKIVVKIRQHRVLAKWNKPSKFDQNVIVLGAGAAGLVSSYIASAVKAKVTLIERGKMGGDCLNTGCVPSKAIIRTAKWLAQVKNHQHYGVAHAQVEFNFADVMARVHRIIKKIEPHDSIERYERLGVNVLQGEAKIIDPWTVEVNNRKITAPNIIVATGAEPWVPPIPGLEDIRYYTSDTLWGLTRLPKRLLVLGAGPIGCELAQTFSRLGAEVVLVEMANRILVNEDEEVSTLINDVFLNEGMSIRLEHKVVAFKVVGSAQVAVVSHQGREEEIIFDAVLIAVGRAPRLRGFGLEALGVKLQANKALETNAFLQTSVPTIYACGDVVGPYQFTHAAAHQAWYATVNCLFGRFKRFKPSYRTLPRTTFTDPEVGRVGLNEREARASNIAYDVTRYGVDDLDRAITDGSDYGFVKVLTAVNSDKILGATVVSEHAGELIAELTLAMQYRLGLNKILATPHTYPTFSEANRFVAGAWKRNHTSQRLLKLLEKFHRWPLG